MSADVELPDDGGLFPEPERAPEPRRGPTDPQVVERGTEKPYRARKVPEAIAVHLCGYGEGVLVLRCHDLDNAAVVTGIAGLAEPDSHLADLIRDTVDLEGEQVWVRWVPPLDEHNILTEGPGTYERELRGTIGATPAVLYARKATQ